MYSHKNGVNKGVRVMRLTVRKRNKHKRRKRNRKFLVLFVVAPLVSITLGLLLTKKVVIPYVRRNSIASEQAAEGGPSKGSELRQMSLYNIEVGRFKSFEESESFLKRLNNDNLFAYVSKLDDYVIYTSLTFEKKDAEDRIDKIKENYPDAKINSINIDSKKVHVSQSEKNLLTKVLASANLLSDSYKSEMNLWLNGMKDIDNKKVKEEIDTNNKKVKQSLKAYSETFLSQGVESQELRTLYLIISQNLETREKIVAEFDLEDPEYIKKTYYDFIKSLFTYTNYYNM